MEFSENTSEVLDSLAVRHSPARSQFIMHGIRAFAFIVVSIWLHVEIPMNDINSIIFLHALLGLMLLISYLARKKKYPA